MNNPFTPAEWDRTYDLAGAQWMPSKKGERGCALMRGGNLWGNAWFGHPEVAAPLLPSPAWINEQANPRAVAIAALEWAGFECVGEYHHVTIGETADQIDLRFWHDMNLFSVYTPLECFDPALAHYAADCFTVLHDWAEAINWEVRDES